MVYYNDDNHREITFFFFFSIASAGGCHQITFSNAENTWANKPGIIYLYFRFTYLEAY